MLTDNISFDWQFLVLELPPKFTILRPGVDEMFAQLMEIVFE